MNDIEQLMQDSVEFGRSLARCLEHRIGESLNKFKPDEPQSPLAENELDKTPIAEDGQSLYLLARSGKLRVTPEHLVMLENMETFFAYQLPPNWAEVRNAVVARHLIGRGEDICVPHLAALIERDSRRVQQLIAEKQIKAKQKRLAGKSGKKSFVVTAAEAKRVCKEYLVAGF